MMPVPRVAVVIPAYNAAETLEETLVSVSAQTLDAWEVVLIDDGSTDGTSHLGKEAARRDPRIRYVRQENAGMGPARNAGLAQVTAPWVVFLDSDDWLLPDALDAFVRQQTEDPGADVILGEWSRVALDGVVTRVDDRSPLEQVFHVTAAYCPWAIHSACVRTSVVRRAGGFHEGPGHIDPDGTRGPYVSCADWDLWQRLARMGARFSRTPVEVARYRTRPQSAVMHPAALLRDGLVVIDRGHGADARVADPDPRYVNGDVASDRSAARLAYVSWPAGMLIGLGQDARPLLEQVRLDVARELEPSATAASIYQAALLPSGLSAHSWPRVYPEWRQQIASYFGALEQVSQSRALASRAILSLERRIVMAALERGESVLAGGCLGILVEVTAPIPTVDTAPDVVRVCCQVRLEGKPLGVLELPSVDGRVPASVLADAIADHHGWHVLGAFLGRTVYPGFDIEAGASRAVRRGEVALGAVAGTAEITPAALHDAVGWAVFLQEFWGRADWDRERFTRHVRPAAQPWPDSTIRPVELSGETLASGVPGSFIEASVGAVPLIIVAEPEATGEEAWSEVVGTISASCGYELCRVAVREALLGRPLDDTGTLRQRLARRAAERQQVADHETGLAWDPRLTPGWRRATMVAGIQGQGVLPRWTDGLFSSSFSRRVAFPAAATPELLALAAAGESPVLPPSDDRGIVYEPGVLWVNDARHEDPSRPANQGTSTPAVNRGFDRHHFEAVFAAEADPWRYATPFEQRKYEQTLSLLPSPAPRRALEVACAEGMFTRLLAPCVGQLTATDISAVALARAAARCTGLSNVAFERLDLAVDPLAGPWDLIVCSEVLYYLKDQAALSDLARRFAAALAPGGVLIMAHCNVVRDDVEETGLDWDVPFGAKVIGQVFAASPSLVLEHEIRTPLYRIQRFRRARSSWFFLRRRPAPRVEAADHAELPPHLRERFVSGRPPRPGGIPQAVTWHLPILMYHRVAPTGSEALARYRTTPAAFEDQLRYLRDAGFRSATLDEWRRTKDRWEPLPGRNVVLTFDDATFDFAEFAWPLLRQYGFSAMLFAVTDHVGGTNAWDAHYGDVTPLLSWDALRALDREGVEVGSHSATHAFLTAVSPADVVREAAQSRRVMGRELGHAVTSFAYPHGAEDPAVQHLVGGCGYLYGLSCRPGPSHLTDSLLALPRIEVTGDLALPAFIRQLGG